MITTVDPVREYVEEMATADVRATIDWLDRAGFRLAASQGGRGEAFGNALLVFSLDLKRVARCSARNPAQGRSCPPDETALPAVDDG
jgi:hypothetical protein